MDIKAPLDPLTAKSLLLFAAIAAAVMLGSALVAQYGFGLYPCELCIAQRYPYVAIIVIGGVGYFAKSPRVQYILAALCTLLFLIDSGIAFYHTGVEYNWFPTPDACSAPKSSGHETLEELRAQIMNAPLITCNQAMGYIFGLSLAVWNCLAAFVFFLFMLRNVKKISHG